MTRSGSPPSVRVSLFAVDLCVFDNEKEFIDPIHTSELMTAFLFISDMRNSFNLLLVALACFDNIYLLGGILESLRKGKERQRQTKNEAFMNTHFKSRVATNFFFHKLLLMVVHCVQRKLTQRLNVQIYN
jgi:hypothetical protein